MGNNLATQKRWRVANRDKMRISMRKHDLKRHYGLTPEQWEGLFVHQGRTCAACGSTHSGRKSGHWSTDHDHKTGVVRGILCNGCNLALGHLKDDVARIALLLNYMRSTCHSGD